MKKVLFAVLLMGILTGLLGCKTTRTTQKTDTKQDVTTTLTTDNSRTEQTGSQISAALSSNERQNLTIEFEEWEYYPAQVDTISEDNAQNSGLFTRIGEASDKPPNTENLKKHRKGTITINADKQTGSLSEQKTTTTTDVQASGMIKTNTKARTSESTKSTSKGKWYAWPICGLLLVAVAVFVIGWKRYRQTCQ